MPHERGDFLNKPFCQATLLDHRRLALSVKRHEDEISEQVFRFLGTRQVVASASGNRPGYDLPQVHHAIRECFPEWSLKRCRGLAGRRAPWPERVKVEISPGVFHDYLVGGTNLYISPSGARRVVVFERQHEGDGVFYFSFSLIAAAHDEADWARDVEKLQSRIDGEHSRRQVL